MLILPLCSNEPSKYDLQFRSHFVGTLLNATIHLSHEPILVLQQFIVINIGGGQEKYCDNNVPENVACHKSPSSSMFRAPDQRMGGHGFDLRRGIQILSLPYARDKLNITSLL